jgi:twitching motility protein PilT
MADLEALLRYLSAVGGSDLHLKVGSPPRVRVDGRLEKTDAPPLSPQEMEEIAGSVVRADRLDQFRKTGEADCAYGVSGVGRFRVNAFRQRGSVAMVFRRVLIGSPGFDALGLPPVVRTLSDEPRGLVLVTGPTGAGKTTTLAAMIDHINASRECHVVTLEDPIEILHPDKLASINQREIGVDTLDFLVAMRHVMRQDPDVILVGEMRDSETVRAALAAAETGHLVLSTLHTIDATETVNRVIDFFPPFQHGQVRIALAGALRGIICQRLAEKADGGRVPILEVLVNNGRIQTCIVDPEKTSEIYQIVQEGEYYGMQTFDQHLFRMLRDDVITLKEAMRMSSKPADFRLMVQNAGLVSTEAFNVTRVGV